MAGVKFEKYNDTFYMYGPRFNRRALEKKSTWETVRPCLTSGSNMRINRRNQRGLEGVFMALFG
jgi:hypothetical protein